ncbi:MAG TPA: hypothetical protein VN634_02625 [Candidatus Limnocylindrales bacterium]|jgi:hypothetical protein|nr:hypothetical protein [Candidatus Limnocylindrales bacterium]
MYRYSIDESRRFVVATFEGEVGDTDLFDYLAHMLANTRYGSGWRSLIDLTTAEVVDLTRAGVQRMRALPLYMEERLNGARAAVLAPRQSAAYGMARMYAMMGSNAHYEIAVFSDRDEAMRWLFQENKPA